MDFNKTEKLAEDRRKRRVEGLCFRCEHRARFLETGMRPRMECGDITSCKYGCYMYRPVRPVLLKSDENDDRPQFGPAFISSRSYFGGIAECFAQLSSQDGVSVVWWIPLPEVKGTLCCFCNAVHKAYEKCAVQPTEAGSGGNSQVEEPEGDL